LGFLGGIIMKIEARLQELGFVLPEPLTLPEGARLPFPWVHVRGRRVFVSGHGPQQADGSFAGPFGKVGAEVSPEQAYESARLVALAMLGSLKRELGDLDRVTDFTRQPTVINGFSDVILAVYGETVGAHARSAVGMAALPFGIPVEVEAEVEVDG
jgi:enamine deaminase RidA (YjgF/YER057c/UK114 family)